MTSDIDDDEDDEDDDEDDGHDETHHDRDDDMPNHMTNGADPALDVFDLGLRLLDRQLVGSDGELLGNVDNLLLEMVDGRLWVTALVCGPVGLAPRFGGRIEVWMRSIWRRLRPEREPMPLVIPMTNVVDLAAAVTLDEHAQQLAASAAQLERWLRRYVIGRIPGATGGPDRLAGEPLTPANHHTAEGNQPGHGGILISSLLGTQVVNDQDASAGVVLDVCTEPPHRGRHRVGALPVQAVIYGRRRLGARMGYSTQREQGPWLIGAPLRAWHSDDRIIPIDDLHIDLQQQTVAIIRADRSQHLRQGHHSSHS